MDRLPDPVTGLAGGGRGTPRIVVGIALVTLFLGGAGLLGAAFTSAAPPPPQPPEDVVAEVSPAVPESQIGASVGPGAGTPAVGAAADHAPVVPTPAGLPRSEPTRITIPKIKVDAAIIPVGVNENGTVQVPPLNRAQLAGWYRFGATPGEPGNTVIVGHVDSAKIGPAVFFRLGALRPGDTIGVTRADGRLATFVVERIKSYPKTAFPTDLVYGATDRPGLQVVTCGGKFDRKTREYPDNIVVSARFVS
jgi:hypothetical protein